MKTHDKSTARLRGKIKKLHLRHDRHGYPILNVFMTCPLTLPGGRRGASMINATLFATRKSPHLPEDWYERLGEGQFIELTGEFESYHSHHGEEARQAYQIAFPRFMKSRSSFEEASDFAIVGTVVRVAKNLVTFYVDKSYTRYDGVRKEIMYSFDVTFPEELLEQERNNLVIGARYEVAGMIVQGYFTPNNWEASVERFARSFYDEPVEKVREDLLLAMYANRILEEEDEEYDEEDVDDIGEEEYDDEEDFFSFDGENA